jgi:hypothetical protein
MLDNLTDIEGLAIAKIISEDQGKLLRSRCDSGLYAPDFSVRVYGTLKIGNDYEQRITAKANPWKLLAIALSKLSRPSIAAFVRQTLDLDDTEANAIKAEADSAIEAVKKPTLRSCRGKVTSHLMVARIGDYENGQNENRRQSDTSDR